MDAYLVSTLLRLSNYNDFTSYLVPTLLRGNAYRINSCAKAVKIIKSQQPHFVALTALSRSHAPAW